MHLPAAALPGALSLFSGPSSQAIEGKVFGPRSAFWEPQQLLNLPQEGTFTPTIIGTTTAGVGTYTIQVGQYVKIGSLVFFSSRVAWTAHTGTGNLRLDSLPFTANGTTNGQMSVSIGRFNNIALTAGNLATAYVEPATKNVVFIQYPTGGGAITAVPIDTAGDFMVAGCYRI